MASTKLEIYNMALDHIGEGALLSSISDTTLQAKACNRWYDVALKSMLEEREWGFAHRSVALALIDGEDPSAYSRFSLAYGYPAECLVAGRIYNPSSSLSTSKIPFVLGTNADKDDVYILTDEEEAYLEYTAATNSFTVIKSSLFQLALSHRLAAYIAMPLVKGESGRKLRDDNLNMNFGIGGQAGAKDANEKHQTIQNSSGYKSSMK